MSLRRSFVVLVALGSAAVLAACATAVDSPAPTGSAQPDAGSTPPKKDSGTTKPPDAQAPPTEDAGAPPIVDASVPDVAPPPVPLVYGHTADTLFVFDPKTSALSQIGTFSGCTQSLFTYVMDLAIDETGQGYATTSDGLYSVDLTTAVCTKIMAGGYPNSLAFVPKGTLDANDEVLVGYIGGAYFRIDRTTGQSTNIGNLGGGYASSGDIVSVKGGGTFLTVTGNGCADCVLQVDHITGAMFQNYWSLGHGAVYGLAYWAGALYGFDESGSVFAITGGNGTQATTQNVLSGQPKWWGAASSTSAPLLDGDGGSIATQ